MSNKTIDFIFACLLMTAGVLIGLSLAIGGAPNRPSMTIIYDCRTNTGDATPEVLSLCKKP
jgi:hypothetical protein